MFFGLFGGNKKTPKAPEAVNKLPSQDNAKVNSDLNPNQVKSSPEKEPVKSTPATASNTIDDEDDDTRPGPNGCADICTREE